MKASFILEYLKHFRTVGAVAPSSRYLAERMVEPIDFSAAGTIVQYGPGTGSFTHALLAHRRPGTVLLLIERNEAFYTILMKKFGNQADIIIEHDSAAHIGKLLKKHRLPDKVDAIISGLPFASLPKEESHHILAEAVSHLRKNGLFVTFQYTLLRKPLLDGYFPVISIRRERRNLPPAYILQCRVR